MKSQKTFKAITMFATVLVLTIFSSVMHPLKAQSVDSSAIVAGKPDMQVKFLGTAGEYLYFELAFQQNDETRSSLRIRNENGNELYAETSFQKAMVRKLKIAKDEAEKLEFVYNTVKGDVKKTFEIKIKMQEAIEVKDITRL